MEKGEEFDCDSWEGSCNYKTLPSTNRARLRLGGNSEWGRFSGPGDSDDRGPPVVFD
uniref:Uncharacterized protein ORF60 n=1 Tax=Citrus unshiu TaxID=55188 RepID=F8WLC7_CITUN|nr:hypothetical protein [Citrus unshiu]